MGLGQGGCVWPGGRVSSKPQHTAMAFAGEPTPPTTLSIDANAVGLHLWERGLHLCVSRGSAWVRPLGREFESFSACLPRLACQISPAIPAIPGRSSSGRSICS